MTDLEGVVLELFADVTGVPAVAGLETTPDDAAAWDSLTHVRFVHAIERRLEITLPESALVDPRSLRDIVETVAAATAAS